MFKVKFGFQHLFFIFLCFFFKKKNLIIGITLEITDDELLQIIALENKICERFIVIEKALETLLQSCIAGMVVEIMFKSITKFYRILLNLIKYVTFIFFFFFP